MAIDTPALRFLNRGKQLGRLQQRVLNQVMGEINSAKTALNSVDVKNSGGAQKLVDLVVSGIGKSHERISDVDLMLQLFYARHVDNFQIFLEELLEAILVRQPGLLKRSEPVSMEEVLSHSDMALFVRAMIDRRPHGLAYKSIQHLARSVKTEMKFELFPQAKTEAAVARIFDRRNLITHNYEIVNRWFLGKYPDAGLQVGQPFPYTPETIKEELQALIGASSDIERRARQKFKVFEAA